MRKNEIVFLAMLLLGFNTKAIKPQETIARLARISLTILHTFNGTDGSQPTVPLTLGDDQCLYGIAEHGGKKNCSDNGGCGTIFKLERQGNGREFQLVFSFPNTTNYSPTSPLVSLNGTLYGLSAMGLNFGANLYSVKINESLSIIQFIPSNSLSAGITLQKGKFFGVADSSSTSPPNVQFFSLESDGSNFETFVVDNKLVGTAIASPMLSAENGYLYGTASRVGTFKGGTVFRLDPLTQKADLVCSFNETVGTDPLNLMQTTDDRIFGVAVSGGTYNAGTLFEVHENSCDTVHSFNKIDGLSPIGKLVQYDEKTLYGTTLVGGKNGRGNIYEVTLGDEVMVTSVYDFDSSEGGFPSAGLTKAGNNTFYGVNSGWDTIHDRIESNGTIFEFVITE